jgi:uncharacterized radical SAM protein YgiQ
MMEEGGAGIHDTAPFLPVSADGIRELGWDRLDVLLITGDAYVDHPSFGVPLIGRYLESLGYRVGILPQPDPDSPGEFLAMGVPALFVGVSSGAMDSMVNHYTSLGRRRSDDAYSEGGEPGRRPDRALLRYVNSVQRVMKGVPVVIGGMEASLRRVSHYDFWSDAVRKSILLDTKADLLVYGMGERAISEVASRLSRGEDLRGIRGTAWFRPASGYEPGAGTVELPSHEDVSSSGEAFMEMTCTIERESNPWNGLRLYQKADSRMVVLEPPALPLETAEFDSLYELPFTGRPHPMYTRGVPAFDTTACSVTAVRGCPGGCSFCAIGLHQGRMITSRSPGSVLREIGLLTGREWFRGTVSDIGGPTANMYGLGCGSEKAMKSCRRLSCLHPEICRHFITDQSAFAGLLSSASRTDGVNHVFVSSGIRHDVACRDPDFVRTLVSSHVSGQLRIAPEHFDEGVLRLMRKCGKAAWTEFLDLFRRYSREAGKEQYVLPYLMAAFPGCTREAMGKVRRELQHRGMKPEQVQIFLPGPMTMATAIYLTGLDPESGGEVFVERSPSGKKRQLSMIPGIRPGRRPDRSRKG